MYKNSVSSSYEITFMVYWVIVTLETTDITLTFTTCRNSGDESLFLCSTHWKENNVVSFIFANTFKERTVLCMAKSNAAEKRPDKWTCEAPLSDCEATVTVRLSPITHRGNSIQQRITKGPSLDSLGKCSHKNTKSTFFLDNLARPK